MPKFSKSTVTTPTLERRTRSDPRYKTPAYVDMSTENILSHIHKHEGRLTAICKDLGCAYPDLIMKLDTNTHLADAVATYRIELVDLAEEGLRHHLKNNNIRAIMFTLKTIGRSRGYIERNELAVSDTAMTKAPQAVDLDKLDTEQLKALSDILGSAISDRATVIDGEVE